MPPRRDPRTSSTPPPAWDERAGSRPGGRSTGSRGPTRRLPLPKLPRPRLPSWRSLALAALAALGAVGSVSVLAGLWPERDRVQEPRPELTASTLAPLPRRAVTVLVIGVDADRLGAVANGAAPTGPANADALVLVRVNPKGPLQVLNLPPQLAVQLPGERDPRALGDLYARGGIALTSDAVRELVGLEPPAPDRYLVVPRGALRELVEKVGGLELNPPRTMKYHDKAQKYRIDLQSGLQRLGGAQVEQMVRFRDKALGESGRRANQQLVESALRERLAQPEQLVRLPELLRSLQDKVETNLSEEEILSLLAAGLDPRRPLQFAGLPLEPEKKEHGGLRQLTPGAPRPLWKAP